MQSDPLLLVITLLTVVCALASAWMSHAALRRCQTLMARHTAPSFTAAPEERSEHGAALDARLTELERQLRRISEQQKQPPARDVPHPHYEPAIRLAQKGADVEDLVATCGLARGEAELIALLHRKPAFRPATQRPS
jgi:hypothetical protein